MISVAGVSKAFSGEVLYENATFQINPGDKIGLVGKNGAGKTTFFKMIVGEEKPDTGQVSIASGSRVSYFSQKVSEMSGRSVIEEVMAGNSDVEKYGAELKVYEEKLCDPELDPDEMNDILEKMGEAQTKFERAGGYEIESNAKEMVTGLGIPPEDHGRLVDDFSGGQKMRIALAKTLINLPDLILMDEPTNYLDLETIIWLENWLKNFKGAVMMTSHDREFMNKVVTKIYEVTPRGVIQFSGNYDFFEGEKKVRKKQNAAEHQRQQDKLKKEEDFIARFQARASHAAQVQSRVKKLEKIERVELEADAEKMNILLPEIDRGGNDVVLIKNLTKSFSKTNGEELTVFEDFSTTINRAEKLAVVGVNGAGKSTLLRIIIGELEATKGAASLGPSIKAGYFGKTSMDSLISENNLTQELARLLPHASDGLIRNILAAFLFKGDDVYKKVRHLSGGEKARLVLAWLLSSNFNFLILDEPTNHLDIHSREVLLDALKRYEGTIVIVSHDRFFLREISTKVLEISKGNAHLYPGDYEEYLSSF
jgi:ATP-binding cassette, subfamily F, member 3